MLPTNASVVDFGIGHIRNYAQWKRMFDKVYAYDVNPKTISEARRLGIETVWEQDVSVPFEPRCRAMVAVCQYVFEHINAKSCVQTVLNMQRHAPIHSIKITHKDDPNYTGDPTHIHPRSATSWSRFLKSVYDKMGWARIFAEMEWCSFCYVDPRMSFLLTMKEDLQVKIDRRWKKWRDEHDE
jgi:hypothetical protein